MGCSVVVSEKTREKNALRATRRAVAMPFYVVAFLLSYTGDFLGFIAAKIAGDPV
jgi:hypothetical protein